MKTEKENKLSSKKGLMKEHRNHVKDDVVWLEFRIREGKVLAPTIRKRIECECGEIFDDRVI